MPSERESNTSDPVEQVGGVEEEGGAKTLRLFHRSPGNAKGPVRGPFPGGTGRAAARRAGSGQRSYQRGVMRCRESTGTDV
jgi:hypothetical protein